MVFAEGIAGPAAVGRLAAIAPAGLTIQLDDGADIEGTASRLGTGLLRLVAMRRGQRVWRSDARLLCVRSSEDANGVEVSGVDVDIEARDPLEATLRRHLRLAR
jgi:hypothetical protein